MLGIEEGLAYVKAEQEAAAAVARLHVACLHLHLCGYWRGWLAQVLALREMDWQLAQLILYIQANAITRSVSPIFILQNRILTNLADKLALELLG